MPKPRIPDDIRKQAVDAYCFGPETTVAIARRLGISQGVLARLVHEAGKGLRTDRKTSALWSLVPPYDRTRVMSCGMTIPDAARALYRAGWRVVGGQCNWRVEREQAC
jgi:transposase-like protein